MAFTVRDLGLLADGTPSTTAAAGAAAGTGAAAQPSVSIEVIAGAASGAGTTPDATAGSSTNATATPDAAAGTGVAADAMASIGAFAAAAAGTGVATDTGASPTVQAAAASGTGTAPSATASIAAPAGAASGAGAAAGASAIPAAAAGAAAGSGAAAGPSISVRAYAGAASGTGTAATPRIRPAAFQVGMRCIVRSIIDRSIIGELRYREAAFEDELNGVGSGQVTFIAADNIFEENVGWGTSSGRKWFWWSAKSVIIDFLVDNVPRFAIISHSFTNKYVGAPANEIATEVTVSGQGIGSQLDAATVFRDPVQTDATDLPFMGQSRASIIASFIAAAAPRFVADGVALHVAPGSWSGSVDSHGAAWTDADNVTVRSGENLLALVTEWARFGWDWRVDWDGTLEMWALAGNPNNQTALAQEYMVAASDVGDLKAIRTTIVGEKPDGTYSVVDRTSVALDFGHREQLIQFKKVVFADQPITTLTAAVADQLAVPGIQRNYEFTADGIAPYDDFVHGDTIRVWSALEYAFIPVRVLAITAKASGGQFRWGVVFDTLLTRRRDQWCNDMEDNRVDELEDPGQPWDVDNSDVSDGGNAGMEFVFEMAADYALVGAGATGYVQPGGSIALPGDDPDVLPATINVNNNNLYIVAPPGGEVVIDPPVSAGGSREIVFSYEGALTTGWFSTYYMPASDWTIVTVDVAWYWPGSTATTFDILVDDVVIETVTAGGGAGPPFWEQFAVSVPVVATGGLYGGPSFVSVSVTTAGTAAEGMTVILR